MKTMNSSQTELIATPQFDLGRWKWRLEFVPVSAKTQTNDEHNFNEPDCGKRIFLSARQRFRSDAELQ